jgi:hypothetical protein
MNTIEEIVESAVTIAWEIGTGFACGLLFGAVVVSAVITLVGLGSRLLGGGL